MRRFAFIGLTYQTLLHPSNWREIPEASAIFLSVCSLTVLYSLSSNSFAILFRFGILNEGRKKLMKAIKSG